jgi:site-specific recombinase XerD
VLQKPIWNRVGFLEKQGHSLRLVDLHVHDARAYIASLQGDVTKYEGHPLNKPVAGYHFSPVTVHTHAHHLRMFSTWLTREGWTKRPIFELLELPKLPKTKIDILSEEEIRPVDRMQISPRRFAN